MTDPEKVALREMQEKLARWNAAEEVWEILHPIFPSVGIKRLREFEFAEVDAEFSAWLEENGVDYDHSVYEISQDGKYGILSFWNLRMLRKP